MNFQMSSNFGLGYRRSDYSDQSCLPLSVEKALGRSIRTLFLIGSASNLQVRPAINSQMSSNFGEI